MSFEVGPKTINNVRRHKERASYDYESVHRALDEGLLGHVGFCLEDEDGESTPVVIPMVYGRKDNFLYLHGYVSGRLVKHLAKGKKVSMAVTELNGLVLALSPFHHSVNYRSVVVFGRGELVEEPEERLEALQIITDHMVKGRWDQCRDSTKIELQTTKVIRVEIESASVKESNNKEPNDDPADYKDLALCESTWSGVVSFFTNTIHG
ncbi:uncharacterized protein BX664DRAFT_334937 [Halteromyces radiatus]|uniref:uncharacterized protein n=1 Tax=Halteromyces radiatus TaxID=101107 RepID=UPI00221F312E|nr:uncharacterized protein BX664DRAFT_334937 [Halteromyces radiatus]KAI8086111.1 hypothetical protein BX664DRAFT_334937 [Halteromyces radiatus]